jgi:shikimate dehydrogenase
MRLGRMGVSADPDLVSLVHARALRLLGEAETAGTFAVAPGQLATAIDGLIALGFRGVSLAPAHQREAAELCDTVSDAARTLGRATFLHFDATGVHAENLDAEVLHRRLGQPPALDEAAVVGAGMATGAAVVALARLGFRTVTLHPADAAAAARLLHRLAPACPVTTLRLAPSGSHVAGAAVIHTGEVPIPLLDPARIGFLLDLEIPPQGVLAAFVASGGSGEDGVPGLVHGALRMLELWRGSPIPGGFEPRLTAVVRAGGAGFSRGTG